MSPYHYPDFEDHLIIKFLTEFEKNEIYWAESEKKILKLISETLERENKYAGYFLDAGCGKGRLLEIFAPRFSHSHALEPDPARYSQTAEMLSKSNFSGKVELFNCTAQDYRSTTQYDFILCSHVIQHIHTDDVLPLLTNLHQHLNSGGLMAITTCHSNCEMDNFNKDYLKDGKPVSERINKEEYNRLIEASGILPIRFFNKEKLVNQLQSIGLKLIIFRSFHVAKEERDVFAIEDIDTYINNDPELQKKHGLDMFLLLRKA